MEDRRELRNGQVLGVNGVGDQGSDESEAIVQSFLRRESFRARVWTPMTDAGRRVAGAARPVLGPGAEWQPSIQSRRTLLSFSGYLTFGSVGSDNIGRALDNSDVAGIMRCSPHETGGGWLFDK